MAAAEMALAWPRRGMCLSENWTMTSGRDLPTLVRWAREAEDAGFDAVMISEHVVLGPAGPMCGPDALGGADPVTGVTLQPRPKVTYRQSAVQSVVMAGPSGTGATGVPGPGVARSIAGQPLSWARSACSAAPPPRSPNSRLASSR
jgi:hypothetical protein